ncbi:MULTISPECIES: flagellar hook-basal body complex protein FliE [Halomonas]|uniref:Flagellar hook-basal body complex protein FliE n=3 Tax=Halomonas TaxID=2745 RepID=A0AAU7KHL6_9GAMM|nr:MULTISPECIES: flagellar hook-basal body complex protein FliE [Halomonas]MBR9772476.1 flagellar hook-basal body complex protein FliE [Gammaproteobacteria bacterium]KJZ16463.1 flagellar hook-basal body protein FliE [Halomonas sp. S2151]MAR74084.1 flagellar hook-basal body complex protein FliE [Halomonas sp.]MAY72821.1 flagellar hook-basal body complex protein FliE [Halomonas sp.]MBR9880296.1 flagellar hook-basal body complex protein FliE [Gammaproteobacteria bacterium]
MSTPAMQSALAQMTTMAREASQVSSPTLGGNTEAAQADAGFADALKSSIQRINELKATADSQAKAFQAGVPGVELNDVMVDMQKASVAFQMGQQVRNRLVSAYRDVMNMQV